MHRNSIPPRLDWKQKVESQGLCYHTIDNQPYWDETVYYSFSLSEIDELEAATQELHEMCIKAVEHVISNRLYQKLAIPAHAIKLIEHSWNNDEPSILGRFDLAFDGKSPPKLLEYNADTPTALLEASVIQWFWLKDRFPRSDQFNSIHEKLITGWQEIGANLNNRLYFSSVRDAPEDLGNIEYLRDTAIQAGLRTEHIFIEDLGYNSDSRQFVDMNHQQIKTMFKLYPWEWMINEHFGHFLEPGGLTLIEPAWKMILSNKGILAVLWELNQGHPNLLAASFDSEMFSDNFVSKPLFSREGANISVHRNGTAKEFGGSYGGNGAIFQELAHIPAFNDNYPVIGSWVIHGESAGIGIREDSSEVTTNASRFVPHLFE